MRDIFCTVPISEFPRSTTTRVLYNMLSSSNLSKSLTIMRPVSSTFSDLETNIRFDASIIDLWQVGEYNILECCIASEKPFMAKVLLAEPPLVKIIFSAFVFIRFATFSAE